MMLQFRTAIEPHKGPFEIDHQHKLLSIGSCFAEKIGILLKENKFQNILNPFGIIYNPISLGVVLQWLISEKYFEKGQLFQFQNQWHSFQHHGSFSGWTEAETLNKINLSLAEARKQAATLDYLILTFGTAMAFFRKEDNEVVANCHKMPGHWFSRKRLSIQDVISAIIPPLQALKKKLPQLKIILSVSPVRHLRDGLITNQRSKAVLVLAAEQICEQLDDVYYFPAYELLLDDLRDYRFYNADLSHPNDMAIQYIWEYFNNTFFSAKTLQLIKRLIKLRSAFQHRPFHQNSEEHQSFLKSQLSKISKLEEENPLLNFEEEKRHFSMQLSKE